MRICFFVLVALLTCGSSFSQAAKQDEVCYNPNLVKDTTKKSIKSMATALLGKDSINIAYHSPGVRGRIIWGGLVPFDEVWVTGAHNATALTIPKAIEVGGKQIPAGKYAVFTIPGKETWTVIINRHWNQHLAGEYDEKDDIVRVQVKPQTNVHTERLQYFIDHQKNNEYTISVAWEKIRISLPFRVLE